MGGRCGIFSAQPGIAFRVTFAGKNFQQQHELQHEFKKELSAIGDNAFKTLLIKKCGWF